MCFRSTTEGDVTTWAGSRVTCDGGKL